MEYIWTDEFHQEVTIDGLAEVVTLRFRLATNGIVAITHAAEKSIIINSVGKFHNCDTP